MATLSTLQVVILPLLSAFRNTLVLSDSGMLPLIPVPVISVYIIKVNKSLFRFSRMSVNVTAAVIVIYIYIQLVTLPSDSKMPYS